MAFLETNPPLIFPGPVGLLANPVTEVTLNNTGEKLAIICAFPVSGTVDKLSFGAGAISGPGTFDVTLFSVDDATGEPTGSAKAVATAMAYSGSDDNRILEATFDSTYVAAQGEPVAVVIEQNSVVSVAINGWSGTIIPLNQTYVLEDTGSGYSFGTRGAGVSIRYTDTTWRPMGGTAGPAPTVTTAPNLTANTSPDETGVRFSVAATVKISGFTSAFENDVDNDLEFRLYDTDGTTILETIKHDKDERATTAVGSATFWFANEHVLTGGSLYRITMAPTVTSGSNIRMRYFNCVTDALGDSLAINWRWTEQTDGGGFSEILTRIPIMGIIITAFDDGAGGGGTSSILGGGNMSGGFS